jgi:hypothetical protein
MDCRVGGRWISGLEVCFHKCFNLQRTNQVQFTHAGRQEGESIALNVQLAQTLTLAQFTWQRHEVVVAQNQLQLVFFDFHEIAFKILLTI